MLAFFCCIGSLENYLIGCYTPLDAKSLNTVKLNANEEYLSLPEIEQCKITCSTEKNQIFLFVENSKCFCVSNRSALRTSFAEARCTDSGAQKVYTATNLNFFSLNEVNLDLDVVKIVKSDVIELDDSVGFKVSSKNSAQNFKTFVDFGENTIKTSIGNSFLFHQYSLPGSFIIKITVVRLNTNKPLPNQTFEFSITVLNKQDKLPMFSLRLGVASKVFSENKWNANVSLEVGGGSPYSCYLNFGDMKSTSLELTTRVNSINVNHVYDYTGLFNITAKCASKSVNNSYVSDWKIAYLPNKEQSVKTFERQFKARSSDQESEIKLELPFQMISSNLIIEVDDLISNNNAIVQWVSPELSSPTKGKLNCFQMTSSINNNRFI